MLFLQDCRTNVLSSLDILPSFSFPLLLPTSDLTKVIEYKGLLVDLYVRLLFRLVFLFYLPVLTTHVRNYSPTRTVTRVLTQLLLYHWKEEILSFTVINRCRNFSDQQEIRIPDTTRSNFRSKIFFREWYFVL